MKHYTYLIKYKNGLKYMGVRSCNCEPTADTKYVGSSRYTPDTSEIVYKKILNIYESRKEAVKAEIAFHEKHDIGRNSEFLNKCKQTSTKFDTTGITFKMTLEHRLKIKKALTGRKRSPEECKAISIGKKGKRRPKHSKITKYKIGIGNLGKTIKQDSIDKMVTTRRINNSYNHTETTKLKIAETIRNNPPNTSRVKFNCNGIETLYTSISDCSRKSGIKRNSLCGRLQRIPGKYVNSWSIEYVN